MNSRKIGNRVVFIFLCVFLILAFFSLIFPPSVFAQPVPLNSGQADSPQPVFGHDARHTNVSPYAVGKNKKELLWNYKTGASIEPSPVIGTDGTVYIGSHDGYFYAINSDGSEKWKVKLTEPIYDARWNNSKSMMAAAAIAGDGTIYINSASGYLHALNPTDGKEKWRFAINWHNDFWNGPNIGPDGTIYIGTARFEGNSKQSGLYALNPDGTQKWFVPESSGVTIVPTIANDNTVIYGAANPQDNKGRVIALSPDGKKKWEFVLKEWLEGSAAIGPDGTIYSGSKEGDFYALNPDGTQKWRFHTNGGISATPTIDGSETVYIGSWDGNFYALDQKSGAEKWRFDAKVGRDPKLFEGYPGKETLTTNAALSHDGVLIFADIFGVVYGFDTQGKELWRWATATQSGFASSPAIGKDGTIYIGGEDGNLYALSSSQNIAAQTKNSVNQPDSQTRSKRSSVIIILLLIVFALAVSGLAIILYPRVNKKTAIIILIALAIVVIAGGLIFILNRSRQNSETNSPRSTSRENAQKQPTQDERKSSDDDFIKNAVRVSDAINVWIRDFGEVGRSCAGKGCGAEKDTCVRWNKTKDQCYETAKTKPASSDKYKIYCNLAVVNLDQKQTTNLALNLNYITADEIKHLVQKESHKFEPGGGYSLGWSYEVDAQNLGKCGYSDVMVK